MSNVLKSVGKVFKKVAKVVKPFIKPAMIGAAIYFGGSALGMWGPGAVAPSAAGPPGVGGAVPIIDKSFPASSLPGAATVIDKSLPAASGGTTYTATSGLGLKDAAKSMLEFINKNPAAAIIGGQMLSSAFTPTEAEEAIKLDKYKRNASSFYGVSGKSQGSDVRGLYDAVKKPRGIIAKGMGNY